MLPTKKLRKHEGYPFTKICPMSLKNVGLASKNLVLQAGRILFSIAILANVEYGQHENTSNI